MTMTNNLAPDWGHRYGITELWSEVAPGLYVGGTADDDVLGVAVDWETDEGREVLPINGDAAITLDHFDAVVTMYALARPVHWGVEELRWGIMDGPGAIDEHILAETVAWAHRRWKAGKNVLVRCQAGLNRSSLVAALVLMEDGMEAQQAIDVIRRRRARRALFNPVFVRYLQEKKA